MGYDAQENSKEGAVSDDTDRILQAVGTLRGDINERFNGINLRVDGINVRFEEVNVRFNNIYKRFDEFRAELTDVRVELMPRMDRLRDDISAIRDVIATNFGATDTVRRANKSTREETRSLFDLVMKMERQIQRLQSDVRTLRGQ